MRHLLVCLVLTLGHPTPMLFAAEVESVNGEKVVLYLQNAQDESVRAGDTVFLTDYNGNTTGILKVVENRGLMADTLLIKGRAYKANNVIMPYMPRPKDQPKLPPKPVAQTPPPEKTTPPPAPVKSTPPPAPKPKPLSALKPKPAPKGKPVPMYTIQKTAPAVAPVSKGKGTAAKAMTAKASKATSKVAAAPQPRVQKPSLASASEASAAKSDKTRKKIVKKKAKSKTRKPMDEIEKDLAEEMEATEKGKVAAVAKETKKISAGNDVAIDQPRAVTDSKTWRFSTDLVGVTGAMFGFPVYNLLIEARMFNSMSLGLKANYGSYESNQDAPLPENRPMVDRLEVGGQWSYNFSGSIYGSGTYCGLGLLFLQEKWASTTTFPGADSISSLAYLVGGYHWRYGALSLRFELHVQQSRTVRVVDFGGVTFERSPANTRGISAAPVISVGFLL